MLATFATFLLLLLAAVLIVVATAASASPLAARNKNGGASVMPFLCLQRCDNQTEAQILQNVSTLVQHADLFPTVSYERYNIGPNCTLVVNSRELTNVGPILKAGGINLIPILSSYPYPAWILDAMRACWASEAAAFSFLSALNKQLDLDNASGATFDWEPASGNPTNEDAQGYATFLGIAARYLARRGKTTSVCYGGWSKIWNLTLIGEALSAAGTTPPAQIITMNTYTWNNTVWNRQLQRNLANIAPSMLTTALGAYYSQTQVDYRFDALTRINACRVAVWTWSQMNATWISAAKTFLENCGKKN